MFQIWRCDVPIVHNSFPVRNDWFTRGEICNDFNVQREICCNILGEITLIKWTGAHADRISLQSPFGRRGTWGSPVFSFFSSYISVILILMYGIAVSSSLAVYGFSSFWFTVFDKRRSFTVLRYHLFSLPCLMQVNTMCSKYPGRGLSFWPRHFSRGLWLSFLVLFS